MKRRIIGLIGVLILLIISVSIYASQGEKGLEELHSEEYVNEVQNILGYDDENEEGKTKASKYELNGQGNTDPTAGYDDVAEKAVDIEDDRELVTEESSVEEELITETDAEANQEELVEEESIIKIEVEADLEESVVEEPTIAGPVEKADPVDPEPASVVKEKPSSLRESFSEIFIKERINLVENPDTKEEFEAVLLYMCERNMLTYVIEYEGISFDDLLTDETQAEIAEAFDSVFNKYPEYMSFTNRMTYRAKGNGDTVTLTVTLESDTGMDAETLIRNREAFFVTTSEIVGELEDLDLLYAGQSDREKALVLFDWVVQHTEYDYNFAAESYTGYGVYKNGLGVCQGYTAAYNALCKYAGLSVEGVGGLADGGDHIWTRALFAGENIFIDATWGDSYVNSEKVNYDYFLVDGATLAASHTW